MKRRSDDAARQLQVADVADERDVRVVDRDGQLGLVVERRGRDPWPAAPRRDRGLDARLQQEGANGEDDGGEESA